MLHQTITDILYISYMENVLFDEILYSIFLCATILKNHVDVCMAQAIQYCKVK